MVTLVPLGLFIVHKHDALFALLFLLNIIPDYFITVSAGKTFFGNKELSFSPGIYLGFKTFFYI